MTKHVLYAVMKL